MKNKCKHISQAVFFISNSHEKGHVCCSVNEKKEKSFNSSEICVRNNTKNRRQPWKFYFPKPNMKNMKNMKNKCQNKTLMNLVMFLS